MCAIGGKFEQIVDLGGTMNFTLLKALVVLLPALVLFLGALVFFVRGKALCFLLQLLGAGCLVLVPLTHVAEALRLLPWMHWGMDRSPGHYLDLSGAALGLTLFPIGYLLHAITQHHG